MSDRYDELRQAIVRWSTNYTEMDRTRVQEAKPLMDNLWQAIESLQRENEGFRRLMRVVAFEDLDADAADAVTVREVVIKEARDLLGEQGGMGDE